MAQAPVHRSTWLDGVTNSDVWKRPVADIQASKSRPQKRTLGIREDWLVMTLLGQTLAWHGHPRRKGFNLNLNALPINGRVVMRINDTKDEKKGRG